MKTDDPQKDLVEKHKKMFPSDHGFGFEFSQGWFPMIAVMCDYIQSRIDYSIKSQKYALKYNAALKKLTEKGNWGPFLKLLRLDEATLSEVRRDEISKRTPLAVPEIIPQVVMTQIKEKFGTLRIYYTGGDEAIYGATSMVEGLSGIMCDVCGAPGIQVGSGWISTRCKDHANV